MIEFGNESDIAAGKQRVTFAVGSRCTVIWEDILRLRRGSRFQVAINGVVEVVTSNAGFRCILGKSQDVIILRTVDQAAPRKENHLMHSSDHQLCVINKAIMRQIEIDRELRANGVKDLVGDYGEILAHRALGGSRTPPTTEGHDIDHPSFGRVQVKTRKYELQRNGRTRKEDRAVGFKPEKPNQFDWLCHIVLDIDYSVVGATLVAHKCVWPEITAKSMKVKYAASCSLPSSVDITAKIKAAAAVDSDAALTTA